MLPAPQGPFQGRSTGEWVLLLSRVWQAAPHVPVPGSPHSMKIFHALPFPFLQHVPVPQFTPKPTVFPFAKIHQWHFLPLNQRSFSSSTFKEKPANIQNIPQIFFLMSRNSHDKGSREKKNAPHLSPAFVNIYNAIIVYVEFYSFSSAGFLCAI